MKYAISFINGFVVGDLLVLSAFITYAAIVLINGDVKI